MTPHADPQSQAAQGEASLVVFELDGDRYALDAAVVDRATRAARPTALPGAPPVVLGIVDVHGDVVPVLDVRQRFGKPRRPIAADDVLVLARTERRPVALLVDAVDGVESVPRAAIEVAREVLPGTDLVAGVATLGDGLVLVHDLERFLSLDEQAELDRALNELGGRRDDARAD